VTVPSQISLCLFLNETLSEKYLANSRLCIAAMTTLQYVADNGGLGLTKSGAFKRDFVVWAVDQFDWPGYTAKELAVANKVLNEDDVLPLSCLHELLRIAKLIRHANGKALLTKAGTTHLGDHGRLQAILFETFFTKFDFAAHERFPIEMPDAVSFSGSDPQPSGRLGPVSGVRRLVSAHLSVAGPKGDAGRRRDVLLGYTSRAPAGLAGAHRAEGNAAHGADPNAPAAEDATVRQIPSL
jgi:hypothetical protein